MAELDDPIAQADDRNPSPRLQSVAAILNVAAPLVALITAKGSAFVATMGILKQFLDDARRAARIEALLDGIRYGVGRLEGKVEVLEQRISGPDAEEAIVTAVENTLMTARLEKATRFGRVIGSTLGNESPDWSEATEFIRNLEELGEQDIAALRILWRVQRTASQRNSGRLEMLTDANRYTDSWNDVLGRSASQEISRDDWYARCARLSGFGLAIMVTPNGSFQGPDAVCYRMTGRGVRLLELLGWNVDKGAYPAIRYHPTLPSRTVHDEDEDDALEAVWADTPAAFARTRDPT